MKPLEIDAAAVTAKPGLQSPEELLERFFQAMFAWELACAASDTQDGDRSVGFLNRRAERIATLQEIYREFCTEKPRVHGRAGDYHSPPEYDPRELKITRRDEISPRQQWLHVDHPRYGGLQYRYLVSWGKGSWRIDRREFFSEAANRWEPCEL